MGRFPTAGHLDSWAGVCPGHHESAGRTKSTHTRPGNPYLKAVLGTAAMNAARNKDSYLGARYRRLGADRPDPQGTAAGGEGEQSRLRQEDRRGGHRDVGLRQHRLRLEPRRRLL
jgi:Transposase IS116/IS110/IS902 family